MKKKLLSLLLAGVMVLSLAACGGGGEEKEKEADPNKLTVMAWDPNFNIPALKAAEAEYKKTNPDFVLEIMEQSGSGDVETAIKTAATAGDYTNVADIVLFQDHYINKFYTDYPDAWVDIADAEINWDDFSAEKLSYSTLDGKHYGVPVDNGAVITAYRVDILEECGYTLDDLTGVTWDEFITIGKDIYAKTGKYLACMDGNGNDMIYMMMQAEGASQFKDGKPYITENETLVQVIEKIVTMAKENVLYLANDWSGYTNDAIQKDMVAGVMNGNWIIPTMKQVTENSGKWALTTMPTLDGHEGYAGNGGSSLYITAACQNVDLAKDFLAKTFGSSTAVYDQSLTDGGVIGTYLPASTSEIYNAEDEFFGGAAIYSYILSESENIPVIEQSDFHYTVRGHLGTAIVNIINGADFDSELKAAEDQLKFDMGL